MKVVCINNGSMDGATDQFVHLTLGKAYEVIGDRISSTDFVYSVINDIGNMGSYYHKRFELLEVARDKKLKQLGI